MTQSDKPPLATISFAVCAIPAEPIRSEVTRASMAITQATANRNVIDDARFPAHLTFIISGTDESGLRALREAFRTARFDTTRLVARAAALSVSRGTTITVTLEGDGPRVLHDRVLDLVEPILTGHPALRPHLDARWESLLAAQRTLVRRYGSYKVRESFDPHVTVATVAPTETPAMEALCARYIQLPQDVRFAALQLVDVGHENQRWTVLESVQLPDAAGVPDSTRPLGAAPSERPFP
jgi:2'-5' RNA ligase